MIFSFDKYLVDNTYAIEQNNKTKCEKTAQKLQWPHFINDTHYASDSIYNQTKESSVMMT